MQRVRRELMEMPVPVDLHVVVKQLIPLKGIRRNDLDGSELLDCIGDGPCLIKEGYDTNLSDDIVEESGSDDEHSIAEAQTEDTPTV